MQFTPKTASEIAAEKAERAAKFLLPKGTYDFEVISAEDTKSKNSGAEMIKVGLKVYGTDGSEHFVTDYLLESMAHKFYHFAHGIGRGAKYDSGNFGAADCDGGAGKVKLKIEESQGYDPKNSVQDYVVPVAAAPAPDDSDTLPGLPSRGHAADEEDLPDFLKKP